MRILFVGDIFGRPGRIALANHLTGLKSRYHVDFASPTEKTPPAKGHHEVAQAIYAAVDVITLGNHAWDNKDVFTFIDEDRRLVRAYNFPRCAGRACQCRTATGQEITVARFCGRFMTPVDCPFRRAEDLLRKSARAPCASSTSTARLLPKKRPGLVSRRAGDGGDRHPYPRAHRR